MKNLRKLFVGVFAVLLCFGNVWAEKAACPKGCFCLNEGEVELDWLKALFGQTTTGYSTKDALERLETMCQTPSSAFSMISISGVVLDSYTTDAGEFKCGIDGYIEYGTKYDTLVCNRKNYFSVYANNWDDKFSYFLEDFSELYSGEFGIYGIRNNEPIYINASAYYDHVFQCPFSYPKSNTGAKTITDCYKYDDNRKKVYYKPESTDSRQTCPDDKSVIKSDDNWIASVICQPGYYMPSDTNECKPCRNDDVCPGGIFYVDKKYLFDRGTNKDTNYGWVASVICQPGYYVPANTTECKTCPSGNACPGGVFYVDKTYNVKRGIISDGSTISTTSSTTNTGGGTATTSYSSTTYTSGGTGGGSASTTLNIKKIAFEK